MDKSPSRITILVDPYLHLRVKIICMLNVIIRVNIKKQLPLRFWPIFNVLLVNGGLC